MVKTLLKLGIVLLLTLIAISCESNGEQQKDEQNFGQLNVQEAKSLIDANSNNSNFVIIDMRTPPEINQGFIKDAVFIDFMKSDFQEKFDQLDRNKMYLIYCQRGYRSGRAFDMMKEGGFKSAYNMYAGFGDWSRNNFPTEFR